MKKEKKKKGSSFFRWFGLISMLCTLILLGYYMLNVDVGEWIAKESYDDKGEWLKQLGLFIATMAGFMYFVDEFNKMSKEGWLAS